MTQVDLSSSTQPGWPESWVHLPPASLHGCWEVAAEGNRGARFTPPISNDELALYDAVAQNESAVDVMGEGVLAQIARDLVKVMQRDIRTDWTVRDDVRAKLRSSIKRLLAKHGYPPDQQPAAIKLVMEQMESMAPRYAQRREAS